MQIENGTTCTRGSNIDAGQELTHDDSFPSARPGLTLPLVFFAYASMPMDCLIGHVPHTLCDFHAQLVRL